MSVTFQKRIKEIQREINDLRVGGAFSTSFLAVAEQTVEIQMQIVGYSANDCAGKNSALVEIQTTDGRTPFLQACVEASDEAQIVGRRIKLAPTIINGNQGFEFTIVAGSSSDQSAISGGGSVPAFTIHLTIFSTSEFNATVTYRQEH